MTDSARFGETVKDTTLSLRIGDFSQFGTKLHEWGNRATDYYSELVIDIPMTRKFEEQRENIEFVLLPYMNNYFKCMHVSVRIFALI